MNKLLEMECQSIGSGIHLFAQLACSKTRRTNANEEAYDGQPYRMPEYRKLFGNKVVCNHAGNITMIHVILQYAICGRFFSLLD